MSEAGGAAQPAAMSVAEERPLLDAYASALDEITLPFSVPGHKRRTTDLDPVLGRIVDVDVPLFAGLDTMRLTERRLQSAESIAARLWGADWCRFGVAGASQANQALLLSLGTPGQRIVMSRSIHRSVMSGLVLSGLDPVWLPVRNDPATSLPLGPTPEQLAAALDRTPDCAGVWITEPSYLGTVADVSGLADVAHAHGAPLVVDQAWGAHFGFHPGYPPHALQAGADAMVVSAHKGLPSYSQAALLLASTARLSAHRLEVAFDATHTTSPAGAILASIDGGRHFLSTQGHRLLARLAVDVEAVRAQLRQAVPDLVVPGPAGFGAAGFDPLKLVVGLARTGADGVDVESELRERGITFEMADLDTVVATIALTDTPGTLQTLAIALIGAITAGAGPARPMQRRISFAVEPRQVCTPRAAFFAPDEAVPSAAAAGRTSAELVAVYPPGIPVLSPGEMVTKELVDALHAQMAAGSRVAYADDPTLATIRVLQ